jgi:TM2 domain-containing membrane protein YozV
MSRAVYALSVPALVAVIAAFAVMVAIMQGFQMEGCRFTVTTGDMHMRNEWLVVGGIAGLIMSGLIYGLHRLLMTRVVAGSTGAWATRVTLWLGITAVVAWYLSSSLFATACNAAGLATTISGYTRILFSVSGIGFLLAIAVAYLSTVLD